MKRVISLFVLVVMCLAASAGSAQEYYTLPELREQAKDGWHETYTDKYGRTTVVDIDTPVYGEDQAPILEIVVPGRSREEAQILIDVNDPYNSVCDVRKKGGSRTHLYHVYGEKIELDKVYGEEYGTQLTVRQAYELMYQMIQEQGINPDMFFYDCSKEFDVLCNVSQSTGEAITPAFYYLAFWQQMYKMPILEEAMMTFNKQRWPMYCPWLDFIIRNENEYSLCITPMEERKAVVDDIPLCSFNRVIENLGKKIESGHIQKVYDLQFGYSIYTDPNPTTTSRSAYDADCFYAVPSWVMECIYMTNPKETFHYSYEEELAKGNHEPDERGAIGHKTITINAQTGKMLDPMDRSHGGYGDARYKGFISWEDVQ